MVRRAHHVLERVCAQTGEAASLALARRSDLVYVDEVAPPSVLTVNWLARPVPLHATSTGKAWLAWLPRAEARGVLGPALEGFTDATVTDFGRLFGELAADPRAGLRRVSRRARARAVRRLGSRAGSGAERPLAVLQHLGPGRPGAASAA